MKVFNFYQIKKIKNFEKNLIRIISTILIVLFLFIIILYYSSEQKKYLEQLNSSNENIIEQVVATFEIAMKQIKSGIYRTPLYDNELISMIKDYKNEDFFKREIINKLDSINLGNDYFLSSYLFLPAKNTVFSSDTGDTYLLENFPDKEGIYQSPRGVVSFSEPRYVETRKGKELIISVNCPIPLYTGDYEGMLIINIDANKLFYDILKKIKTEDNMNFYVYTINNIMIINKDESLLFKKFNPEEYNKSNNTLGLLRDQNRIIRSSYFSKELNWNFVLETNITVVSATLSRIYSIVIVLIILLFISLIFVINIIKASSRPLKKVLSTYNEKLWVDFLTDNSYDLSKLQEQLTLESANFTHNTYAIFVLQILKVNVDQNLIQNCIAGITDFLGRKKEQYDSNVIIIHKSLIAILINFEGMSEDNDSILLKYADEIYSSLEDNIKKLSHISISSYKDDIGMVPMAYRECMETLNYKIASNSRILQFCNITAGTTKGLFEYPYEIEKQLVNNLIVGNPEGCMSFLEKFFKKLINTELYLTDNEIKNYIYQLQTSILKYISVMPISIKIDKSINILDIYDLNEIKTNVMNFVADTAAKFNRTEENSEPILFNNIIKYIDKKYTIADFNLNTVAEEFSINRNYLTKIVKEKTGDNFNDYINKKRIGLAKSLLHDKNTSIESISHKVGYNYSHYFIKMFKSIEGITPGQYRDRID